MFAGGGSHLTKVGLSALQGSLLIACLTSVIVTLKIEWVLAFISGATPCMALIVFYISEHSMTSTSYQAVDIANAIASIQPVGKNWVHSALLYASFCIFAGAPFLIILCGNSSTKNNCVARQHLGRAWVFMLAIAHSKHTAPRIEYHFIKWDACNTARLRDVKPTWHCHILRNFWHAYPYSGRFSILNHFKIFLSRLYSFQGLCFQHLRCRLRSESNWLCDTSGYHLSTFWIYWLCTNACRSCPPLYS